MNRGIRKVENVNRGKIYLIDIFGFKESRGKLNRGMICEKTSNFL